MTLNFGGLTPITDTVPATNYTFTVPTGAEVVNLMTGPVVDTYQTDTISSGDNPSAFELVNFANKGYVTVDLTNITDPTYITPPATPATGLINLAVQYFGSETTGHTLNINGTTAGTTTTVVIGGYGNTVNVQSVTAGGPLGIVIEPPSPGEQDSVNIGDNGSLANIAAGVTINGAAQSTNLTVDGSAETTAFGDMLLELSLGVSMADLTGVLPGGTIAFDPGAINGHLDLSTGSGADQLTVDFANGNPFVGEGNGSPYTLHYNGGGGGDSLSLVDSAGSTEPLFNSEDYVATGPNSGSVSFYDGIASVYQGGVQFSELTPTTDSTPVTNYTFTPPSSGGTVALTDDATAGFALISDPSSSPTFESVAYSNKTNVTIDATAVTRNNAFILDNPDAPVGESSLSVDLGSGEDTVNIAQNPDGDVAATIDGGVGSQTVTVNGAGLATGTGSTIFAILGGTGSNTLRINDQGVGGPVTLRPGTSTGPAVALLGSDYSMSFANMGVIQEFDTNNTPTFLTPTPLPTVAAVTGVALNDVPVATFTNPT